jgi:putative redox protein
MKTSVSLNWIDKMAFEGELDGHRFIFDAAPESGGEGKGPRPKPFMLFALAGCTGMDVVSILSKMRVSYDKLEIAVESDMTEEHPKHYTSMHVIFTFTGKDLPLDKIQKAVSLSEERYCGVSVVYKKAIPVTTEIRLIEN